MTLSYISLNNSYYNLFSLIRYVQAVTYLLKKWCRISIFAWMLGCQRWEKHLNCKKGSHFDTMVWAQEDIYSKRKIYGQIEYNKIYLLAFFWFLNLISFKRYSFWSQFCCLHSVVQWNSWFSMTLLICNESLDDTLDFFNVVIKFVNDTFDLLSISNDMVIDAILYKLSKVLLKRTFRWPCIIIGCLGPCITLVLACTGRAISICYLLVHFYQSYEYIDIGNCIDM